MKNKIKEYALLFFILLEFLGVAYDGLLNESRIIHPIDGSYRFQASDLPLILTTIAFVVYVVYLVISYLHEVKKAPRASKRITRKISAKFGWFGFFGFFGFLGIPAYMMQGQVWPFFFFVFFGFFGLFYEAKLSNTLMDERFLEERKRAQLTSYKTGFGLLWLIAWFMALAGGHFNTDLVAIIFSASSSLIIALVMFLKHYLLYKYDTEEEE